MSLQLFSLFLFVFPAITNITYTTLVHKFLIKDSNITYKDYKYESNGSLDGNLVDVTLEIKEGSPLTSLSIYASTSKIPDSKEFEFELSDFYGQNPYELKENFDLDAMWEIGRKQKIVMEYNLNTVNKIIYYRIFHFDEEFKNLDNEYEPEEIEFIVTVKSGSSCFPCDNNGKPLSNVFYKVRYCYCHACENGASGKICSRIIKELPEGSSNENITALKPKYLKISKKTKVKLMIEVMGKGKSYIYIQTQSYEGEVANVYNKQYEVALQNNISYWEELTTNSKTLLITIINPEEDSTAIIRWNSIEEPINVLIIVVSVLGSLLLIGMGITIFCVLKKRNSRRNQVNSESHLPTESNRFGSREIDFYFPEIGYKDLIELPEQSNSEASIAKLGNICQLQKEEVEIDCVICLESILGTHQVRIGYCKHIFHSECLVSWFKKQKNCPYCRKEYSKAEVKKEYEALREEDEEMLKGASLCRAIYWNTEGKAGISDVEVQSN